MLKIWLPFSFLLSALPSLNSFVLPKENVHLTPLETENDYLYTDEEIIKEFYQPISSSATEPSGYLHYPEKYDRNFKIKLPEKDLNLIWKETLETKLEFDLTLVWTGQSRNEKIETHLSQPLDLEGMEKPLICGTIPWECQTFPNLKFNPLIDFSWNSEEQSLVLKHQINSPLTSDQNYILVALNNNGLVKLFFSMSNVKLVYKIPPAFKQISQVNLNLEVWVNTDAVQNINQLIANAVLNDSELKKLKFVEYFETPTLTAQQKESLLKINDNFEVNFQLLLQLKPKYQEEIFTPLLKELLLKISFNQSIDLDQLNLNSRLLIGPDEDPWEVFLNQNLHYKFFFENHCFFQVNNDYLLIEGKPEFSNIIGTLNLPIEFEKPKKQKLNELELEDNLGTFELTNEQQDLLPEEIFNRWKELNNWVLSDEIFSDYSILDKNENYSFIQAADTNQNFEGRIKVYFEKIYLSEPEEETNDPISEVKSNFNFLEKYWWVLIVGFLIFSLITWFIWKMIQDKKTEKS